MTKRLRLPGLDRAFVPYLLLLVPPLCWAGNFVVGRAVHSDIQPIALVFWRWVIAAAVLLPFAAGETWRRRFAIWQSWRLIALLAVTGVVLFQYFVYRGLQQTTAINGALIIATIPAVIPAIAYALDRTPLAPRQALGIGVSTLGVAAIVLGGDIGRATSVRLVEGDLWVAAAVPAWSLYSVLVKRRPVELTALSLLFATVLAGTAMLLPIYLWSAATGPLFVFDWGMAAAIGYVGVFASMIAFLCWNHGVATVGAGKAGQFLHLMPLFAAGLAMLFLGERLHAGHLLGAALIAAGLVLSSTARSRRPPVSAGS